MKKNRTLFSILAIMVLGVAACSPAPVDEPTVLVEAAPEEEVVIDQEPQPVVAEESAPADPQYPNWYTTSLVDVNTGESFSIQENIGKVYLVETLATWCSNCLQQQQEVKSFHELLGERDDFESLGVNIDPNEDVNLLTGYVQKNGFDWKYVVASNEMIDEISSLYGPQFLNPPSTPMLIIDKQGNAHPLKFGIKSAQELLEAVEPYL